MDKPKVSDAEKQRSYEITRAYAEYKTRHAGDLDDDLANWAINIQRFMNSKKQKK